MRYYLPHRLFRTKLGPDRVFLSTVYYLLKCGIEALGGAPDR
jgi:hypothetical protein